MYYTWPEVDQGEDVITWHGELIRSYAIQAASEKVTRLANETITMLRDKWEKVAKEDGKHSGAKYYRQAGQGRDENGPRTLGTSARSPGFTPPFDTDRPQGPLHDGGPSCLRVHATSLRWPVRLLGAKKVKKSQITHRRIKLSGGQRLAGLKSQ